MGWEKAGRMVGYAVMATVFATGCGDDGMGGGEGTGGSETTETAEETGGGSTTSQMSTTSVGTGSSATQGSETDPDDDADPSGETETEPEALRPNWHEDIAPLVVEHCGSCHIEGGLSFPMLDYSAAEPLAPVIALRVERGDMPPWHALETDECQPPHAFESDARLDDETIALFSEWSELGAPQGDPALAAPLPEIPDGVLADPTVTTTMGGSLTVQPEDGKLDFYHCLSFDPGNETDVFVDAMQVIPGNSEIVHHVLIYVDTNADSASWTNGISEDCGGGAGIGSPVLVAGWVPGGMPTEAPASVATVLPAGARIVYNVHYHASALGPETDDGTGIALRWSETPPEWVSQFRLVGAPGGGVLTTGDFLVPPGETAHEEVIDWTVPAGFGDNVRLWSILPHMHKVGVDLKTSIIRDGEETCLVQTPDYDFDWQRLYEYDAPIEDSVAVQPGDIVRIRCRYDNSLGNPEVVEILGEQGLDEPVPVVLGDGTLDEMCTIGVGLATAQ